MTTGNWVKVTLFSERILDINVGHSQGKATKKSCICQNYIKYLYFLIF